MRVRECNNGTVDGSKLLGGVPFYEIVLNKVLTTIVPETRRGGQERPVVYPDTRGFEQRREASKRVFPCNI